MIMAQTSGFEGEGKCSLLRSRLRPQVQFQDEANSSPFSSVSRLRPTTADSWAPTPTAVTGQEPPSRSPTQRWLETATTTTTTATTKAAAKEYREATFALALLGSGCFTFQAL